MGTTATTTAEPIVSSLDRKTARTADKPLSRGKGMKPKGSYTLTALLEQSEVSLESEEAVTSIEPK